MMTARPRKLQRQGGRKRKRRLFSETRVGYFLQHEAPLEYNLIMEACGPNLTPPADLIETIGYASINPLFKKPKFRRSLMLYRQTGLYCGVPMRPTPRTEMYYIKLRRTNKIPHK